MRRVFTAGSGAMTGEDRSSAIVLQYTPREGPRRKLAFEPVEDGTYDREEYEMSDDGWRFAGSERVESVSVEDGHGEDDDRAGGPLPPVYP